jgi:hypothetical protein
MGICITQHETNGLLLLAMIKKELGDLTYLQKSYFYQNHYDPLKKKSQLAEERDQKRRNIPTTLW